MTMTITVPWWAYALFAVAVLALVAGGYVAGWLDGRDAGRRAAIDGRFAPVVHRWRAANAMASKLRPSSRARREERTAALVRARMGAAVARAVAWANTADPGWAGLMQAWGRVRPAKGYPPPPELTPAPDPRTTPVAVGRAPVAAGRPLSWWEELDALNVALGGRVRWAANAEETGWIPAVKA